MITAAEQDLERPKPLFLNVKRRDYHLMAEAAREAGELMRKVRESLGNISPRPGKSRNTSIGICSMRSI